MLKIILLLVISYSVYAIPNESERKVPLPDAEERGEMVCFNSSQALHKVITSLRGGTSAKYITTKIKENRDNHIVFIINERDTVASEKARIANVIRVTKLAVEMVKIAKNLDKDVTPGYAAAVYYDECAAAIHAYYDKIKKAKK